MFKSGGKNVAYNRVLTFLQCILMEKNYKVKLNCSTVFYFFRLIGGEAFAVERFPTAKPRVKNMLIMYFKEHVC